MSNKNYNILALRGAAVDDMEYIETFGLDPKLAYTPQLNDAMLDSSYNDNITAGVDEMKAKKIRDDASRSIQKLLAQNGMLK